MKKLEGYDEDRIKRKSDFNYNQVKDYATLSKNGSYQIIENGMPIDLFVSNLDKGYNKSILVCFSGPIL